MGQDGYLEEGLDLVQLQGCSVPTTTPNGDHETANGQHGIGRDQGGHNPPIVSGKSCFASPSREEPQADGEGFEDTAGNGDFDHKITSRISVEHFDTCLGVWIKDGEKKKMSREEHVTSSNEGANSGEVGILLKIPMEDGINPNELSHQSLSRHRISDLGGGVWKPGLESRTDDLSREAMQV